MEKYFYELEFAVSESLGNPYLENEFWVELSSEDGRVIRRPGFWDGGVCWRVRLPLEKTVQFWKYRTHCVGTLAEELDVQFGEIEVPKYAGSVGLLEHGLLRMSADKRQVVHADGTPFFMVADTPWALPFRGTEESVVEYALNRRERGFNAALLMAVQPDRDVEGPDSRHESGGFARGFRDLNRGHLNELSPAYFQDLDVYVGILLENGIVPVFSPVFQGFGWKGKKSMGARADASEYLRFVKYLIARYGAGPAMWLANADSSARSHIVEPAGETFEAWDAYGQPTGIHYSPFDDEPADWTDDPVHGFHYNRIHQDKSWLDFQWAQTGHGGIHKPEKVAAMWQNLPAKAVSNGEPTYERMGDPARATGWWQGHEAWLNFVHGGTMGVVYGAGGLWNWKLTPDEEGWVEWADTEASWKQAIQFEGSRFVGFLGKAMEGLDALGWSPMGEVGEGIFLIGIPGEVYLLYFSKGGSADISDLAAGMSYRWFDPVSGVSVERGILKKSSGISHAPSHAPWVLILEA
ncbi:DUF5060 domain-containing protein [Pelagicoccus albus]|uniref:DUF4038 domain-containing protein n=1 Tax=Pelagicoccus albus TaxID=415222 RepID=A0A7X1E950_9BACT|nr:DUF5060 domain-containing protein [Pelagicoccus albus]MBC2607054.1 DUF4038 domain-containing protein [Pelagicoccus albus]